MATAPKSKTVESNVALIKEQPAPLDMNYADAELAKIDNTTPRFVEVAPDFGDVWDFDALPVFTGLLAARRVVALPDLNDANATRDATVYDCVGTDRNRYSIWGSWSIDSKMTNIPDGSIVRIEFKGTDTFKAENGAPRTVKRFKVSVASV